MHFESCIPRSCPLIWDRWHPPLTIEYTPDEYKAQIVQFGIGAFADLTKEGNEPHVQRTAYRLLNVLGAHGAFNSPRFRLSVIAI